MVPKLTAAAAVVAALVLILGQHQGEALIFTPADHNDAMWDTWIMKHPQVWPLDLSLHRQQ